MKTQNAPAGQICAVIAVSVGMNASVVAGRNSRSLKHKNMKALKQLLF